VSASSNVRGQDLEVVLDEAVRRVLLGRIAELPSSVPVGESATDKRCPDGRHGNLHSMGRVRILPFLCRLLVFDPGNERPVPTRTGQRLCLSQRSQDGLRKERVGLEKEDGLPRSHVNGTGRTSLEAIATNRLSDPDN